VEEKVRRLLGEGLRVEGRGVEEEGGKRRGRGRNRRLERGVDVGGNRRYGAIMQGD
jgi:hypothetical protein